MWYVAVLQQYKEWNWTGVMTARWEKMKASFLFGAVIYILKFIPSLQSTSCLPSWSAALFWSCNLHPLSENSNEKLFPCFSKGKVRWWFFQLIPFYSQVYPHDESNIPDPRLELGNPTLSLRMPKWPRKGTGVKGLDKGKLVVPFHFRSSLIIIVWIKRSHSLVPQLKFCVLVLLSYFDALLSPQKRHEGDERNCVIILPSHSPMQFHVSHLSPIHCWIKSWVSIMFSNQRT